MIVRPRLHWLHMLFVWRGSVLWRILPQLTLVTLIGCAAVRFHGELFHWKVTLTPMPFTLVGVALAIFLSFRINASYDRYWEARKLWGALLNHTRALLRQAIAHTPADEARQAGQLLMAFTHALRHQLRGTDASEDLQRVQGEAPCPRRPQLIVLELSRWLARQQREGRVDSVRAAQMEESINGVSEVLGGCERLSSTPIPFPYSVILHRTAYIYCLLLPFGLLDSIEAMTPLIVAFVSYTFFALEELSQELEEPFGTEANDLPLVALSIGIERHLREMLGDTNLPPAPQPVKCVLL